MIKFGYKLMTEEHGPKVLVENAVRAEEAGFDFVSISDHFHPWLEAQGHAAFAWSILGAISHATNKVGMTTGVTCPILRYHPAIIAQAAATVAVMSDNRFTLAVGAGERLNEHITGARWPSTPERHEMLSEAIDIFRALWEGGPQNWNGFHFEVEHAQIYDLPDKPIPIVVAVSGAHSVELAVEKAADGIMATQDKADLVKGFRDGGGKGPAYAEVSLSYAKTKEVALKIAHERFKFSPLNWTLKTEIPNVEAFEAAAQFVRPDDIKMPLGPDVEAHLAEIQKHIDAGFDHIVLLGVGPNQAEFIDFFAKELRPRLERWSKAA